MINKCSVVEEGKQCGEEFRCHFNLITHILKEHKFSPEAKEITLYRAERQRRYEKKRKHEKNLRSMS